MVFKPPPAKAPDPIPPPQSPMSYGLGKKKPAQGATPMPTMIGSEMTPAASGGKTLLGQ